MRDHADPDISTDGPLLNRKRLESYMREAGLDAVILTSTTSVRYATRYGCWIEPLFKRYMRIPGGSDAPLLQSFAILPLGFEPILVVSAQLVANTERASVAGVRAYGNVPFLESDAAVLDDETQRFHDLVVQGSANATAADAVAAELADRGLTDGVLGVEHSGLHEIARAELEQQLPRARLKDCSNLIRLVRAVKTPGEIALLSEAARIAEDAALAAIREAGAGTPLSRPITEFRTRVAARDAAFDHFAYTPLGLGIVTDTARVFRSHDFVAVDFGCVYQGYFSDSASTLTIGEPSTRVVQRYRMLAECVQAGADAAKPGERASAVFKAMSRSLAGSGMDDVRYHGHGMGLELRDYPIVAPDSGLVIRDDCVAESADVALEESMVVNLEIGMLLAGEGSIQVERTFRIAAGGCVPLIEQVRELPWSVGTREEARAGFA